jgi:glycerophosphoryl diester phosphodiesterase
MRPYLSHEHPLRLAHRGSRVLWPENTMAAFQGAADLGYLHMETDIHATRDGRIVIFHDDRLERLTDGTGFVWDWRWEDLRRLDAAHHFDAASGYPLRGRGEHIPLLEEVLATWPHIQFNLDLKQGGIEPPLWGEIERLGAHDRVLVGAFQGRRVRAFRRLSGGSVATAAGPGEVLRAIAVSRAGRASKGNYDALQVPEQSRGLPVVTRAFVESAHRGEKQVHVWTVNDPEDMRRLLGLGVDGIVSDRPDLLNEVVEERATT